MSIWTSLTPHPSDRSTVGRASPRRSRWIGALSTYIVAVSGSEALALRPGDAGIQQPSTDAVALERAGDGDGDLGGRDAIGLEAEVADDPLAAGCVPGDRDEPISVGVIRAAERDGLGFAQPRADVQEPRATVLGGELGIEPLEAVDVGRADLADPGGLSCPHARHGNAAAAGSDGPRVAGGSARTRPSRSSRIWEGPAVP